MTTLSPDMTHAELLRVYRENSDYDLVNSTVKAKLFIQAGRMILANPIRRSASTTRGEEVELEPRIVKEQVMAAERFFQISVVASAPEVQMVPASDYRC